MKSKNHTLHNDLENISDDASALLEDTTAAAQDAAMAVRNRVSSALDSAKDTYAALQKKAAQSAKAADKRIRENPYQAVGIALGVGALIGYLIARRSK